MERNLRLYPYYQAARSTLFWLPVFFLYFAAAVPVDQILLLESIYYVGVVVLEVPSGYFSDRVGRRVTLLLSTIAGIAAYLVFATTASFSAYAGAQLLLAVAMAFNSGTDSSLLYDSLASLGRGTEIGEHEARAQAFGFGGLAVAALAGGIVASFDLQLVYFLSAGGAALSLAIVLALAEPPSHGATQPPLRQLAAVLGRLRDPTLRWVFGFTVSLVVLAHVPYELFQPYVAFLYADSTPIITGALAASMMGVAALCARHAIALRDRFGATATMLASLALLAVIMATMAAALHPVVIGLLMLRSVPTAITAPITAALIHPRIDSRMRATYLSLQSLVARLAFSASLAAASLAVGDVAYLTHARMADLLYVFAAIGVAMVALLAVTSPKR